MPPFLSLSYSYEFADSASLAKHLPKMPNVWSLVVALSHQHLHIIHFSEEERRTMTTRRLCSALTSSKSLHSVRWMTYYAPTSTTRLRDINILLTINDDTTTTATTTTTTPTTPTTTVATLTTLTWGLSSIFESVLSDLRDGILWAVPKSRRSLAKRRWRRKHQALKPRNDIEDCVVCGGKKLQGHICTECFKGNNWVAGRLSGVGKTTRQDEQMTSLAGGGGVVEGSKDVLVEQKGLVSRFTERLWMPK